MPNIIILTTAIIITIASIIVLRLRSSWQMLMDLVLEGLLREHLMVGPLLVVVGITEQLVTMGAEDFKVPTVTALRRSDMLLNYRVIVHRTISM